MSKTVWKRLSASKCAPRTLKIALVLPVETGDTAAAGAADKGADFAILLKPEPAAYVNDDERKTAEAREASSMRAVTRDGCKG